MVKTFTKLRRSIQSSNQSLNKGFTVIELVVAAIVSFIVLGISLGLINQQRRQFLTDQARSEANQNLRLAMEFMGNDIQLAGERLSSNMQLPAISLIDGGDTDPDELVLQRKLLATSLRVCNGFGGTDTTIAVAYETSPPPDPPPLDPPDCSFSDVRDDNQASGSDAKTDSLNDFRDYRCSLDNTAGCDRDNLSDIPDKAEDCDEECALAYVHDPTLNSGAGDGEFFLYTYEDCEDDLNDDWGGDGSDDECNNHISGDPNGKFINRLHAIPLGEDGQINTGKPGDDDEEWKNSYTDEAEIYILEELKYELVAENPEDCDDPAATKTVLAVVQNRQKQCEPNQLSDNDSLILEPMRLVNNISDIDITIEMEDKTLRDSFNSLLTYADDWKQIKNIEVDLESIIASESDIIRSDVNANIDEDYNDGLSGESKKRRLSSQIFPRNAMSK